MREIKNFLAFLIESKKNTTLLYEIKDSWAVILISITLGVVSSFMVKRDASQLPITFVVSAFSSVAGISLIVGIIKFFGKPPSETAKFKKELQAAYIKAVEKSTLNPHVERHQNKNE